MTDVAIINTTLGGSSPGIPVGSLLITGALERAGLSVLFSDYQIADLSNKCDPDTMFHYLSEIDAPVIGLSVACTSLPTVVAAVSRLKQAQPERIIVIGGPGASDCPAELLANFPIDIVVVGEGEVTAVELMTVLRRHNYQLSEQCQSELEQVCGLYMRIQGQPQFTGSRQRLDLSQSPLPPYDRIDLQDYGRSAVIITARGCPFGCRFCSAHSVWQRKVTVRPIADVIAEMKLLQPSVDKFEIWDDTFILDSQRVLQLLAGMNRSGVDTPFSAGARADLLTPELSSAMAAAGCVETFLGIESDSDHILSRINKGFDRAQARSAIAVAAEHFPRVHTSYIWGFPFETMADFYDTVLAIAEDARTANVTPQLTMFTPLPAAPLTAEVTDTLRFSPLYRRSVTAQRQDRVENYPDLIELITTFPAIFSSFYYCDHPGMETKAEVVEQLIAQAGGELCE